METQEKYYVPTIEEFHVGFEFESYSDIDGWKDSVLSFPYIPFLQQTKIGEFVVPNWIRVKHLDREDIESLGFDKTFKNEFGIEYLFFENKDYQYCLYHLEKNVIIFRANKNASWMFPPTFSDAYEKIFLGSIKNKSELKRLMRQLGII